MPYADRRFDRDFASPADYEDGFRESDAVRGERMMRRKSPSEILKALAANDRGDDTSRQDDGPLLG